MGRTHKKCCAITSSLEKLNISKTGLPSLRGKPLTLQLWKEKLEELHYEMANLSRKILS